MVKSKYFELISSLPKPTTEQYINFVMHVCDCHSWYKHLSIVEGAEFIFFLSPYSGTQPENDERLHYSWKTNRQYRERFGFLEYMYKAHNRNYSWDTLNKTISASEMRDLLPNEIIQNCSCLLYPYVCRYANAFDTCYTVSKSKDRFERLENNECQHPQRDLILAWKQSYEDNESRKISYENLSEEEKEEAKKIYSYLLDKSFCMIPNPSQKSISHFSPALQEYYQKYSEPFDLYMKLQQIEEAKVTKCIKNLEQYLEESFT